MPPLVPPLPILLLASLSLTLDQNVLSPHLTSISQSFSLTPSQRDTMLGGYLSGGLFLLGAPASLLIGSLADSYSRKFLLTFILLLGGLASLLSSISPNFPSLFLARSLTGVTLGASMPVTYSILSDLYPPTRRTQVSSVVGISTSLGVGIGQLLSSMMPEVTGAERWRCAFAVVSLPFFLAAFLVNSQLEEPKRLQSDKLDKKCDEQPAHEEGRNHTEDKREPQSFLSHIMRTPTALLIYLQGVPGCLPWSVFSTFLQDYLLHDLGVPSQTVTATVAAFAAGGIVGQIAGGWGGQLLYNSDPRYPAVMACGGGVAGAAFMVRAMGVGVVVRWAHALASGFFACLTGPIVRGYLSNVTEARFRGRAFSCFVIFDDLGKGGGPMLVSWAIGREGRGKVLERAVWNGWVACAVMVGMIWWTVKGDIERGEIRRKGRGEDKEVV
ncbi:hypothetical protein TrCOL_g12369 [Triparma columacea]|uniref:Major facilitator superfamily (MFS) profile domain-containing protein n=1 Tax=Triparma columacea TaxID=722753 RepID=A0A9W7G1K1_9STRA|nr:hypothetical protein TrCOL_g12369 [Triparma columacea]